MTEGITAVWSVWHTKCTLRNPDERGGDCMLSVGTNWALLNTADCDRQACIFHVKLICNLNVFACSTTVSIMHTSKKSQNKYCFKWSTIKCMFRMPCQKKKLNMQIQNLFVYKCPMFVPISALVPLPKVKCFQCGLLVCWYDNGKLAVWFPWNLVCECRVGRERSKSLCRYQNNCLLLLKGEPNIGHSVLAGIGNEECSVLSFYE